MTPREILQLRHRIRAGLRSLFDARGFLEVDTPALSSEILPEAHIDPVEVRLDGDRGPARFLQASPEAHMKRLLARGAGPIYQFARAFRRGERGDRHDVEFVLLEWYEPGSRLDDVAAFLAEACGVALATEGIERVGCTDAFLAHAGVDPIDATLEAMRAAGERAGLALPHGHPQNDPHAEPHDKPYADPHEWDSWFEFLLAEVVAPRLGHARPTMLEDWPASQAALARLSPDDPRIARRFELFVKGVELANGWEEDPSRETLQSRIDGANRIREADRRGLLPMPRRLVDSHGASMPEGVGAALGFDRLVMLAAGETTIDAVRCFTSHDA